MSLPGRSKAARLGPWILALLLVFAILKATPLHAQRVLQNLDIVTSSGVHHFSVEVADTDEDRERGLMFRRFLPPDRGMLFDFKTPQPVTFWMRNTILPLDIIFIAADGHVIRIAEDTEPMSDRMIPSGGAVLGVLEVNAGTARKIGLRPGDKVIYPIFGR